MAVDVAPLYIRDGDVYTSAGVTSALDLTLALIEHDHGPTLTRAVARKLVTHLHPSADQAQISVFLAAPPPEDRTAQPYAVVPSAASPRRRPCNADQTPSTSRIADAALGYAVLRWETDRRGFGLTQ